MAHLLKRQENDEPLAMFRSQGKREFAAWTVIICLVAFGTGAVLVKRLRPVGPMEFQELPAAKASQPATPPPYMANPVPESIKGKQMTAIKAPDKPAGQPAQIPPSPPDATTQAQPEAKPTKLPGKTKAVPELASVSLNAGELADLEKLPGVGPGIAQRIIDYRTEHGPFQSLDELRNVKGIAEKRFAKIEPFLRL